MLGVRSRGYRNRRRGPQRLAMWLPVICPPDARVTTVLATHPAHRRQRLGAKQRLEIVLLVLDRFGIPFASLIAPLTVGGVALGLGAQRLVLDLLSGAFIITERQYEVQVAESGAEEAKWLLDARPARGN